MGWKICRSYPKSHGVVTQPVVMWGAAGQAKVLADCLPPDFAIVALFDNDSARRSPFDGVPIYHGKEGFARWRSTESHQVWFLVAIGGDRGRDRLEIQRFLTSSGLRAYTAIHAAAFVSPSAALGRGCQILPHANVCAGASLGDACIVNTAATVDHECRLEDGVHIAPGATLTGLVNVGACALVGAGAVILPRLRIGRDAVVGAGAVVTHDVPDGAIVAGVPAVPVPSKVTQRR